MVEVGTQNAAACSGRRARGSMCPVEAGSAAGRVPGAAVPPREAAP
jgi:hypothetical protein